MARPRKRYLTEPIFSMACPHCLSAARIRTSKALTPLIRQLYIQCTNVECGHTFVADFTIVRTLSPSACPNPLVELPLTKPSRSAGNDNNVDDDLPPEARTCGSEVPPFADTG